MLNTSLTNYMSTFSLLSLHLKVVMPPISYWVEILNNDVLL